MCVCVCLCFDVTSLVTVVLFLMDVQNAQETIVLGR